MAPSTSGRRRKKPTLTYYCNDCGEETDNLELWFDENGKLSCPICGSSSICRNTD